MIAAVERGNQLCVIRWTGRRGLHAMALTYCNVEHNASNGVVQVPDLVLSGGDVASVSAPPRRLKLCPSCGAQLRNLK